MAVNLSPYGGVGAQFLDNAGNVLTGGKIFTYAAGTTTNQATYTTSAGNIFHPNPIILDASGRVPSGGEIWLTDGLLYKFVLTDSNDVLIATYDNISGINSNFVNFVNQQEIQTATAGQTVFNLATTTYSPGTNSLSVFVDGVNQYGPGAQYAYLETDSDTVTFVNGLHVGASVKFTTSQLSSSAGGEAFNISYLPPFTGSVGTNVGDKLAQTVSVMDFGAVGDGITNDTVAIQAAITACPAGGATLYFPPGTYVVTAPITFVGKSNLSLFGYGATIQCGATRIQSYFDVTGTSTVRFFGFSFNAKMASMPLYTSGDYPAVYNAGIYADTTTTDIFVQNCRFYNLYTEAIHARQVNTLDVQNCLFESLAQAQDQQLQHIWFLSSSQLRVVNNKFLNASNNNPAYLPCGVFASGVTGSAFVDKNFFDWCGRDNTGGHKLGVIDFYFDCVNVTVTNNIAKNVMSQFMRLSGCDGGIVENNYVEISQFAEFDSNTLTLEGGTIYDPTRNTRNNNIKILNNTFYDPYSRAAVSLFIGCYDWGAWSQNILVQGNIFTDCRSAILLNGAYYSVNIVDNMMFSGAGSSRGGIRVESSTLTTNYGLQSASYFNGLLISRNTINCNVPGGIQINIPTLTTAYVGATTIKNNTVDALTQTAVVAIAYNINASVKSFANVSAEENNIYRMNQAFQINNGGNVAVKDNFTVSTVTFATQSGNNAYDAYDNKMQSGVSTGVATLVAGTVNVTGVDCRSGDTIMLSVFRDGGTVGIPYTTGTSNGAFTIVSTSATDTSQIAWKVIH